MSWGQKWVVTMGRLGRLGSGQAVGWAEQAGQGQEWTEPGGEEDAGSRGAGELCSELETPTRWALCLGTELSL